MEDKLEKGSNGKWTATVEITVANCNAVGWNNTDQKFMICVNYFHVSGTQVEGFTTFSFGNTLYTGKMDCTEIYKKIDSPASRPS